MFLQRRANKTFMVGKELSIFYTNNMCGVFFMYKGGNLKNFYRVSAKSNLIIQNNVLVFRKLVELSYPLEMES